MKPLFEHEKFIDFEISFEDIDLDVFNTYLWLFDNTVAN